MVPNPIKMDDFGVPLFLETPKSWLEVFTQICFSWLFLCCWTVFLLLNVVHCLYWLKDNIVDE